MGWKVYLKRGKARNFPLRSQKAGKVASLPLDTQTEVCPIPRMAPDPKIRLAFMVPDPKIRIGFKPRTS